MNAVETRRWFRLTASRVSIAAILVLIGVAIAQQHRMSRQDANYRTLHARAMQILAERDDFKLRGRLGERSSRGTRKKRPPRGAGRSPYPAIG